MSAGATPSTADDLGPPVRIGCGCGCGWLYAGDAGRRSVPPELAAPFAFECDCGCGRLFIVEAQDSGRIWWSDAAGAGHARFDRPEHRLVIFAYGVYGAAFHASAAHPKQAHEAELDAQAHAERARALPGPPHGLEIVHFTSLR